ncbi:NAD dependent epimerase/dehydratase [Aspergillus aurantiobrunneus]
MERLIPLNIGNGPHVLLTGANGFVASHILSILLDSGFAVTATLRSQSKADDIIKTHPSWKGKFALKDIQKEMIEPAVMGTTEILKSAHKHGGKSLKRFVLLGRLESNDTNPGQVTAQQAIDQKDNVLGYNVSKTKAEQTAWEFVKTNGPSFDLTVINPDIITGPMIHPISGPGSINATNQFAVASFIDGTRETIEDVRFPFYHFVDVRDVAQSHVDALTNPAAGGQRILLISGLITPQLVANTVRKSFPTLRDKVPEGKPSQILPEGVHPTGWDMSLGLDILFAGTKRGQWKYIELEQSVTDAVHSMIDQNVLE